MEVPPIDLKLAIKNSKVMGELIQIEREGHEADSRSGLLSNCIV